MTIWNKTAKHHPRDGVYVLVCHYEGNIPGSRMYQTGGYFDSGEWRCVNDEIMFPPKYWTECLESPE